MQKISDQFKGIALDGKITLAKALPIASQVDEERKETVELLLKLKKEVGDHYGEQILSLVAKMEGKRFNSVEFFYDKQPDSQSI